MIKERLSELGWVAWLLILGTIVLVVAFAWFAVLRPAELAVERNAVEQSKSYNDASNVALSNYMVQYESPDATDGQQTAIINAMCEMVSKMNPDLVSPRVTRFLNLHGGCEK